MTRAFRTVSNLLLFAAICFVAAGDAAGQTARPPLLQDITVPKAAPSPAAPSLVQRTGSAEPMASAGRMRTLFPVLAEVTPPGYTGILIENLDGGVVVESNSNLTFNPASNVKVATAYAILKTFGPDFRFMTNVYTDGVIDRNTFTLNGNIYVTGRDPIFGYEHGVTLASELNRLGIRHINGDLIVTDNFVMNYASSPSVSVNTLMQSLDAGKRPAAATRTWLNHLSYSGRMGQVHSMPSVTFRGGPYVQPIPSSLSHLFTHESTPVREILKATLCYSNNFLSERLGDLLGGPFAVARIVHANAGIAPNEFSIQTASGLGYNRVTPNAMMKLLRALRSDLARYKMTFADIMPVAGVDKGTLVARFDNDFSRGSVVGKTGTMANTGGGVSALAGEVNTRNGRLLFVIFNQRGSVPRFRSFQNYFVSLVQGQFGGASSIQYDAMSLDTRMARTRVTYPDNRMAGSE